MRILPLGAALAGAILSGGCAKSTTEAVMRLDPARAQSVGLGEVVVTNATGAERPTLVATMTSTIRDKVAQCARGSSPTRFEVVVTEIDGQNAAQTILLGDSARARGRVKLIDTTSGATIGDYDLSHSKGGGGVIGALALAATEKDMSNAFADQICNRILAGK